MYRLEDKVGHIEEQPSDRNNVLVNSVGMYLVQIKLITFTWMKISCRQLIE